MPRAYSVDLRERALRALEADLPAREIERTFGISTRTLRRWRQRMAAGSSLAPGQSSGRPPRIAPDQHDQLRAQVAAQPDATLAQHCARWQTAYGVTVSVSSMARTLTRLGITLKKKSATPPNATTMPAPRGGRRPSTGR
jgi:transposase